MRQSLDRSSLSGSSHTDVTSAGGCMSQRGGVMLGSHRKRLRRGPSGVCDSQAARRVADASEKGSSPTISLKMDVRAISVLFRNVQNKIFKVKQHMRPVPDCYNAE